MDPITGMTWWKRSCIAVSSLIVLAVGCAPSPSSGDAGPHDAGPMDAGSPMDGGSQFVLESDGDSTSPSGINHLSFAAGTGPSALDVVTWLDGDGQARTLTLANNNNQPGGVATQFTYQDTVADEPVTVNPAVQDGNPVDGYGYVVSHYGGGYDGSPDCALDGDGSSPVARIQGATHVVFQGRNHLIYEIKFQYPREGQNGTCYQIPVTIDWVFAAGRSYPVYSITWDVAGSGAGDPSSDHALYPADSRAPYGAMRFDGSGDDYLEFSKVSWADDVYSFETTGSAACSDTAAVCMNSTWTWNTRSNGFPFVESDARAAARSFAIMATNSGQYMHAGGYADSVDSGTDGRGTTSAARGNMVTCTDGIDAPGTDYLMPCNNDGWPYQMLNWELAYAPPSMDDDTFTDTYAAPMVSWGTDYFVGTTIPGSQTAEGLAATNNAVVLSAPPADAVGYPEASYATFVVYGPTTEVQAFRSIVATIPTSFAPDGTNATGVSACPGGAGRSDTVACGPTNYDQSFAALRVNSADGTHFGVTAGAGVANLSQLTLVVQGYTASTIPATLNFSGSGQPLVSGTDYFGSLRASTHELWLTFGNVAAAPNDTLSN